MASKLNERKKLEAQKSFEISEDRQHTRGNLLSSNRQNITENASHTLGQADIGENPLTKARQKMQALKKKIKFPKK